MIVIMLVTAQYAERMKTNFTLIEAFNRGQHKKTADEIYYSITEEDHDT